MSISRPICNGTTLMMIQSGRTVPLSPFLVPELGLQLVRGVEGSGLALLQLDLQLFDPRTQAHPQLLHLHHKPPIKASVQNGHPVTRSKREAERSTS